MTPKARRWRKVHARRYLALSLILHLILIAYGEYHDRHIVPKYTDVDYRVFCDAVKAMWSGEEDKRAQGWVVKWTGLKIGDPYARATYRYTPLLALAFSPIHFIHPLTGKFVIAAASLATSYLLAHPSLSSSPKLTHLIWSFNPFVLNINTRGSAESILAALVLTSLVLLKQRHENLAAIVWGLTVHWKVYPIIYGASFLALLSARDGNTLPTWRKVKFALISGGTFLALGLACWSIWGNPFLYETYLYHIQRLDHRHNFSPYFYPIYLSLFPPSAHQETWVSFLSTIAGHPLASFLPQMTLTLGSGFLLTNVTSLEFAMFVQTWVFVMFNKVCTSQYFMWWIFLLPPVIPHLRMSVRKAVILGASWVASQALWLSLAFSLEFRAENVYLPLWLAGIIFMLVNGWILVEVLRAYDGKDTRRTVQHQADIRQASDAGNIGKGLTGSRENIVEQALVTAPEDSSSSVNGATPAMPPRAVLEAASHKKWKHASKLAD